MERVEVMSEVGELKALLDSERIEREREFRDLTGEIARLRSPKHPWCSNIARDTAIRAAEDAAASERPPLPDHRDLPERVARLEAAVFGVTESRSADAMTDETSQSGLRTERVTLEITHDGTWAHPTEWSWPTILEDQGSIAENEGESVRVVPSSESDAEVERLLAEVVASRASRDAATTFMEQAQQQRDSALARVAELEEARKRFDSALEEARNATGINDLILQRDEAENERDALKARVAELESLLYRAGKNDPSDGDSDAKCTERESSADAEPVADAEPFAWAVIHNDANASWCYAFRRLEDQAKREYPSPEFHHVPLYRAPPPPRGWLTQDEIAALTGCCVSNGDLRESGKQILRSLLSRNSPPRVRLPQCQYEHYEDGWTPWFNAIKAMQKALAAAGVEVADV